MLWYDSKGRSPVVENLLAHRRSQIQILASPRSARNRGKGRLTGARCRVLRGGANHPVAHARRHYIWHVRGAATYRACAAPLHVAHAPYIVCCTRLPSCHLSQRWHTRRTATQAPFPPLLARSVPCPKS